MPVVKLPVHMQEPLRVFAEVRIASDANMDLAPAIPTLEADPNLRTGPPARIRKMKHEEIQECDGVRLIPPQDKRPPRLTPRGLLMKVTPWFESLWRPKGGGR